MAAVVSAPGPLEGQGRASVQAASNWVNKVTFESTVRSCSQHISPGRLLGFLQTTWQATVKASQAIHLEAIDQAGRALAKWEASGRR